MKLNYRRYTCLTKIELNKMALPCLKELLFYMFKMYILREKCVTKTWCALVQISCFWSTWP